LVVSLTGNSVIARAEKTIIQIGWYLNVGIFDDGARPWSLVTVAGYRDPFFKQWMPSPFPNHLSLSNCQSAKFTRTKNIDLVLMSHDTIGSLDSARPEMETTDITSLASDCFI
jgi:hypothetical protein